MKNTVECAFCIMCISLIVTMSGVMQFINDILFKLLDKLLEFGASQGIVQTLCLISICLLFIMFYNMIVLVDNIFDDVNKTILERDERIINLNSELETLKKQYILSNNSQ